MKKKIVWSLCIVFGVILLFGLGYLGYLVVNYERIPDYQVLEVQNANNCQKEIKTDTLYTVCSYNIGFGAYSDDYSFFMDGGEYARARSKEAVYDNVHGAIQVLLENNPDIIFFQEVDVDSTRSYHINEVELIYDKFADFANNFAYNYHSDYLLFPIKEPHGASNAGLFTLSNVQMLSAMRRSLPISAKLYKLIDLDRCYTVTRVPVENGKELVLYNLHLSAYTVEDDIVFNQVSMLAADMKKEMEEGNYIICGGDFNQDMLGNSPEIFHTDNMNESWAAPFPTELLPQGMHLMVEYLTKQEINSLAPSCRNADAPYEKGKSFVTFVDGFIVSDNVQVETFRTIDTQFKYSDHNPILMQIELKE